VTRRRALVLLQRLLHPLTKPSEIGKFSVEAPGVEEPMAVRKNIKGDAALALTWPRRFDNPVPSRPVQFRPVPPSGAESNACCGNGSASEENRRPNRSQATRRLVVGRPSASREPRSSFFDA
jgi:hypothetical protein